MDEITSGDRGQVAAWLEARGVGDAVALYAIDEATRCDLGPECPDGCGALDDYTVTFDAGAGLRAAHRALRNAGLSRQLADVGRGERGLLGGVGGALAATQRGQHRRRDRLAGPLVRRLRLVVAAGACLDRLQQIHRNRVPQLCCASRISDGNLVA